MAFTPELKNPGDLLKSQDWNQAMVEVVRLESAKVNKTGDAFTGPLTVAGNVGIGTTSPNRRLTIQGSAGTYLNVRANNGTHEVLLGADDAGGIVSTMTNHDLQLRAGGNNTKMIIKADGNVGIGTTTPGAPLHVFDYMAVGPFSATTGQGGIDVSGPLAEFGFVRRSLTSWPHNPAAGDRFVWYNPDGTARLWGEGVGDLLAVASNGNLSIIGNGFKPGGGPWGSTSDVQLKKNVRPLKGALGKLLKLRGVSYEWKEPEKQGNLTGKQMGMVAQEVEEVFPEWIGTNPDGMKNLTIRGFEALVVEALRELVARVTELEKKVKLGE